MPSPPSEQSSAPSYGSNSSIGSNKQLDPVLRNALRYTVSAKEYEVLHKYFLSRAPAPMRDRAPPPKKYHALVKSGSEYNIASTRAALRVFVAVYAGSKSWEALAKKFLSSKKGQKTAPQPAKNGHARTAASFSLMLFFHRILFRFFVRLRASLLDPSADAFRSRNPRVASALASKLTPSIGASLAGLFLGLTPSSPLRTTIAIYVLTRSLEFSYDALEQLRLIFPSGRPSWFGSWLMMPFCFGQLLHSFVFDRDCFPSGFGDFILRRSPEYIHQRPVSWPQSRPYPATYDVVDALASLSKLHWPPFTSPILFPSTSTKPALSTALDLVRPLSDPAHPLTVHTSCALLHPTDPSCTRTYIKFWLRSFPPTFGLVSAIYSVLAFRKLLTSPLDTTRRLARRAFRMAVFITGAIGSAWGTICLWAALLPRSFLPSGRFFLSGAVGGGWAYVARQGERSNFLYCLRLSLDSAWKVGKKHGWWEGVKGGDVMLFTLALGMVNVAFLSRRGAVQGAAIRKGLSWSRGEGWVEGANEEEVLKEE